MFDKDQIRAEWPPLKKAIWDVVTGADLNAPKYVNAYELTDKLFEAARLKEAPSRWIVEERFFGRPPHWVCVETEDAARVVYDSWRRYDDERVRMLPLYVGPLPLPDVAEQPGGDEFISREVIGEAAARIAALVADPKESAAIKTEVASILLHVGFVAATRIKSMEAKQPLSSGCFANDGKELKVGDRVRYRNDGPETKPEYWSPEYEIVFEPPSFTLKHIGGGKDGGSHAFILRNRNRKLERLP